MSHFFHRYLYTWTLCHILVDHIHVWRGANAVLFLTLWLSNHVVNWEQSFAVSNELSFYDLKVDSFVFYDNLSNFHQLDLANWSLQNLTLRYYSSWWCWYMSSFQVSEEDYQLLLLIINSLQIFDDEYHTDTTVELIKYLWNFSHEKL